MKPQTLSIGLFCAVAAATFGVGLIFMSRLHWNSESTNLEEDIQGTWTIESVESKGMKLMPTTAKKLGEVRIGADKIVFLQGDKLAEEETYTLDVSQTPKTIDVTATIVPKTFAAIAMKIGATASGKEAKLEARIRKGIVSLAGGRLRLCLAEVGRERPSDFTTSTDSDQVLMVLTRAPEAEKDPKASDSAALKAAPRPQTPPALQEDFGIFVQDFDRRVRAAPSEMSSDSLRQYYTGKRVRWKLIFQKVKQGKDGPEVQFNLEPHGILKGAIDSTRSVWVAFRPAREALLLWRAIPPDTTVAFEGSIKEASFFRLNNRNWGSATVVDVRPALSQTLPEKTPEKTPDRRRSNHPRPSRGRR